MTGDAVRDNTALSAMLLNSSSIIDLESDEGQTIRTVYAEARGENAVSQEAVANVIQNRAEQRGKSVKATVTAPFQFTAVTGPGDPNRSAYINPVEHAKSTGANMNALRSVVKAVHVALAPGSDNTGGATMYYSPKSMGGRSPNWNFTKLVSVNVKGIDTESFRCYKQAAK